jgi:ribose transport system ATP-binding protein
MKEAIFKATNIVKRFGPTIALNNVDIEIYPGEIRGFIGENGSGKSTMSQIMTGIYTRTSGSMEYHGVDWNPTSMVNALEGGIGIIVQENGTIPQISVAENIFLGKLDNFSGVNYFDKYKYEIFSKYFKLSLNEYDGLASTYFEKYQELLALGQNKYYALKKLKDVNQEELANAKSIMKANKSKIKELRKEASVELSKILDNLLVTLKDNQTKDYEDYLKVYDNESTKIYSDYTNNYQAILEKYNKIFALDVDKKLEETRKKFEINDLEKNYKKEVKMLKARYFNFLEQQDQDELSLKNHHLNTMRKLHEEHESAVSSKVKNALLKVFFGLFVNRKKLNVYAQKALNNIGAYHIIPSIPCGAYDMQSRKLIEIAKCLNENPEIFIVDETTTALSETGRNLLYNKMNQLKDENKSVLFISHDLEELIEKCDTLTVLRDGNIVANLTKSKGEFDPDMIKKYMIGRELKGDYYRSDYDGSYSDEVVLKMIDGIYTNQLKHVDIELHKGEILGIGGLSECGMHTLGKALFGNVKLEGGYVYTGENLDVLVKNEVVAMKHKVGYLSKNRDKEALALKSNIFDNIAIASVNNVAKANLFVLKGDEAKIVNKQVRDLQIKCNSAQDLVNTLSGGNKQKVSLAKWLGNESEIIILDCPTRGVDIGVKQFIYQLMYRMKKEGKSILMISEELPELIGMSDRIIIMKDGQITKEFERSPELTQEEIIKYMI